MRITQPEDWWKISSSSVRSGELVPGGYEIIFVEVDRTGKAHGDYLGFFIVDSEGDHYGFSERVNLTMEVGDPPVPDGPELRNISTNFGNALNQLLLTFNTGIDPGSATSPRNYVISPAVEVRSVSVNQEHVTLFTDDHELERSYSVAVKSITSQQGVVATQLTGNYQFFPNLAGADLWLTGSEEEFLWDNALPQKLVYSDKAIKLGEVPEKYWGCALLQSAWADLNNPELNLKFTIIRGEATVLLAVDPNKNSEWNCDWLAAQFHAIPDSLPVEGSPAIDYFTLFESNRIYQPGDTVALFQNGAPNLSGFMYFGLVRPASGALAISGAVNYHSTGQPVANTQLALSDLWLQETLSNPAGEFLFYIPEISTAVLVPSRTGDFGKRTISMYDAALTARIANDLFPTATEAQRLAADVDADARVTVDDAQKIARHVVGLLPGELKLIGTWQFLPPFRQYQALVASQLQQDFTALVTGDVDGNWEPAASSAAAAAKNSDRKLIHASVELESNQLVVPVELRVESEISAFEMELNYHAAGLEFAGIRTNPNGARFEIFANESRTGCLKLGGFCAAPVAAAGEYFRIFFRTNGANLSGEKIEISHHSVNGICGTPVTLNLSDSPATFRLLQNFPNPFNPQTRIGYELTQPEPQLTVIKIFNAAGQMVRILVNQIQPAGRYSVEWNGADAAGQEVASGLYLVSIESGDFRQIAKMLKLR